jgi:hypothetical protein
MSTHARQLLTKARFPICALIVFALVVPAVAQNRPLDPFLQGQGTLKLKVMTYNMDVGTEYAGMTDRNLVNFLQAADNMVLSIRASDPVGRTQAIARQIVASKPALVSLQEVATLSTGPTKENLTSEFDYLQLLLGALSAQGVPYMPVAWSTTWDATVPTTTGFARNTWSVYVLARADLGSEGFSFAGSQGGTFTNTLVVHLYALDGFASCPVTLKSDGSCRMPWPRGWAYTDVSYRGQQFRIIGAHLDSASAIYEVPQGLELLNGPANTPLPVIVAADLNCDCSNRDDPTAATCTNFSSAGFTDAWAAANPLGTGYTKHLPLMSQRSDYVMFRGRFHVQAAEIVGDQIADKTATGLWPSDHAGVVVRLQTPEKD